MSIIRRGDFHQHVPPRAAPLEGARGGFTFIELLIVFGTLATLSLAVMVAVSTERKSAEARQEAQALRAY